ncbi:NAD(P)-binding protein [Streptomyces finlayi]|uniref:NAD(P)-binding protein n=1 Tax=Streptomyces finlayi TaxID=67296 RepID=A0A7G7BE64_9ACTN|nr:FAD-dependent oxidoreductase [Streptomyces finlayi]QNE73629.1 NAD(P)-binding protein [Streptomyces finlayi]
MTRLERSVDVLVVGGGPAGLAAAAELAASGAGHVEVLEREREAGGMPRHCHRGGFGGRDTGGGAATGPRGATSGPAFARACAAAATGAGAILRTHVSVTGWDGPLTVETTGRTGLERITARALVLATGARERPRSARLIPGSRPAGIYTTGELQRAVHLHGQHIGTRAVVIGNEPVGHAAADTLRAAGLEVVAMVTDQPPPPLPALVRERAGFPLLTGATVTGLTGRPRLSGVELRHADGRTTTLRCDTVVFTGDFVPEHELARRGGLVLDQGTRGPAYDTGFRTSRDGVFAVGNLLHAAESAGLAAAEGRAAAVPVLRFLAGRDRPDGRTVSLEADAPLLWAAPNRIRPDAALPLGGRFILRTGRRLPRPHLVVSQNGRELHRQRLLLPVLPGRPFHLGAGWLERIDPQGEPVHVTAL